jgi:hypothetical protein
MAVELRINRRDAATFNGRLSVKYERIRTLAVADDGVIVTASPVTSVNDVEDVVNVSVLTVCTTFDPIPAGNGTRAASNTPEVIAAASNDAAVNTTPSVASSSIAGPSADGCWIKVVFKVLIP